MNIFERAARDKYTYMTALWGNLSTEDLWDLNLLTLDEVAKNIAKEIRHSEEESFIAQTSPNKKLDIKLNILKYIITDKQNAIAAKKDAAKRKERKIAILEAIEKQDVDALSAMTKDELVAELAKA